MPALFFFWVLFYFDGLVFRPWFSCQAGLFMV